MMTDCSAPLSIYDVILQHWRGLLKYPIQTTIDAEFGAARIILEDLIGSNITECDDNLKLEFISIAKELSRDRS